MLTFLAKRSQNCNLSPMSTAIYTSAPHLPYTCTTSDFSTLDLHTNINLHGILVDIHTHIDEQTHTHHYHHHHQSLRVYNRSKNLNILFCFYLSLKSIPSTITLTSPSQDGRAVQGAAFRSQSGLPGVGSNPTSDNDIFILFYLILFSTSILCVMFFFLITISIIIIITILITIIVFIISIIIVTIIIVIVTKGWSAYVCTYVLCRKVLAGCLRGFPVAAYQALCSVAAHLLSPKCKQTSNHATPRPVSHVLNCFPACFCVLVKKGVSGITLWYRRRRGAQAAYVTCGNEV